MMIMVVTKVWFQGGFAGMSVHADVGFGWTPADLVY
jgi:hypothetical protein